MEDKDAPVIEYVEAIDSATLKVVYNEDLTAWGQYKIYDGNEPVTGALIGARYSSSERNAAKVIIPANALDANSVYTLKHVVAERDL